jgi:glycosyltransferase A (GT-A) superfamily protein (DUF2064 family)
MSTTSLAVLLMAPPEPGAEVEPLLGSERVAELRAMLCAQAWAWAREIAGDDVDRAVGGETLAEAVGRVFAGREGPLLVVWPWLPKLRREHASGALDDLEAGCDVVLGPVIDGGLYLLGLARPVSELLSLPDERWQDPDVMTLGFAAARDAGLEVGILRAERALRKRSDVRAALVDPLLPEAVRRILTTAGDHGHIC